RQPPARGGPGRAGHPGAPGAARPRRPDPRRAGLRPGLARHRLPEGGLPRPGHPDLRGSAGGRPQEHPRPGRPAEAARGPAPMAGGLRGPDAPVAPAQDRRQPRARPPAGGDGPGGPAGGPRRSGGEGRHEEAFGLLVRAVEANPQVFLPHLEMWRTLRAMGVDGDPVDRYIETAEEAAFYRDPHVCTSCRYRADDMLWRCPHCHQWNTFVELRLGPSTITNV